MKNKASIKAPLSRPPRPPVRPCGTACSIAERRPLRLSGRSEAVSVVRVAIIPQPMSTPTAAGTIAPHDPAFIPTPPGSGPRHTKFSRDGKFFYILNEIDGSVSACAYDAARGALVACLAAGQPPEIHSAALKVLAQHPLPAVTSTLIEHWRDSSPL